MKKKIISTLMIFTLMAGIVTGCATVKKPDGSDSVTETSSTKAEKTVKEPEMMAVNDRDLNIIDDNYRTTYEVFVYSYCDSDGDGIGDLKGLTSKLDYIKDLGCNELWLMPINQSTTYHKYDVMDYKSIDSEYGTMEDFETLMTEAHNRGINVILDLVINHSSTKCDWFVQARNYLKSLPKGQAPSTDDCPYFDYYNFSDKQENGYNKLAGTDWYYESRFWSEMPDLNLKSDRVRAEIKDITQFWFDKGVDGFRLDAVKEYYSDSAKDSIDVLEWFAGMVKEQKPDAYLVGEAWLDYPEYAKYYRSGIDSLFDFSFADREGYISRVLHNDTASGASTIGKAAVAIQEEIAQYTDEYINAPFYVNHDMGRSAGYYSGQNMVNKTKMGWGINMMMSGNAFLYYGEEIGMKGAGKDENKRLGMVWTNDAAAEGMCKGPADAEKTEMINGSLEDQEKDAYSIYNYVKQAIKLRNIYPEISRGQIKFEESLSNDKLCIITKEYSGETIVIVFNTTENDESLDISSLTVGARSGSELTVAGLLQVSESAPSLQGGSLAMPAFSIAILK